MVVKRRIDGIGRACEHGKQPDAAEGWWLHGVDQHCAASVSVFVRRKLLVMEIECFEGCKRELEL